MIISPVFDKESNKPLYIQLYEYIKAEITSGLLKPDSKLPSQGSFLHLKIKQDNSRKCLQPVSG